MIAKRLQRTVAAAINAAKLFSVGSNLRRWLLRQACPYEVPGAAGTAWVIYAYQKSVNVEDGLACPLVDPLIKLEVPGSYVYITLGHLSEPQAIPSHSLKLRPRVLEALCTQVIAGLPRLADLSFVNDLYKQQLIFPNRWRLLHVLTTWLLSRHFEVKFSLLAQACNCVHLTVYYNAPMLGLVAAFRRSGKPAWDVQHGYMGPSHDAYNNARAFSLKTALKPSGFIVWDEYFGRHVESILGAQWRSTDYAHVKTYMRSVQPRSDIRRRVLFSLQWGTPVPPAVITEATASSNLMWVFRMHPNERSIRPDLHLLRALPWVQVVDCREPLALAIASADLHVTFNSSVVHEAAVLHVPSLFFDPVCRERFQCEMALGLAQFTDAVGFSEDLEQLIAKAAS